MLACSESDMQRMLHRLNMVSVNYNMKINIKKTKVLRVSKGSESDNEDSSCRGNYRTSQEILLLRKHDLRRCHSHGPLTNRYHSQLLSAKKRYLSSLAHSNSSNPRNLWKTVNNLLHR